MKKIIVLLSCIITLATLKLSAQGTQTALGIRFGPYYGATLKHFYKQDRALEAIVMTRSGGLGITGLYQVHTPVFSVNQLSLFGGIGGHLNIFRFRDRRFWDWDDEDDIVIKNENHIAIGLDLILGLEYTFEDIPINLGVDWKPALNLIGDHGISTDQYAFSLRFVF